MALRPIDRDRLRAIRESRGLSRERLAAAVGISPRTIARAELGEAEPVPIIVAALAAALGVDVESVTLGEREPTAGDVEPEASP